MTTARHRARLVHVYGGVLAYTGLLWTVTAGALLAPLVALPFYPSELGKAGAFLFPGTVLAAAGLALWRRFGRGTEATLSWQEGAVVVVLAWVGAILAASFVFGLAHGSTPTLAVFEATSAWTTTGLSVIDVRAASPLVLLLRSVLEFAGGAGLAIIMLSTLTGPIGAGLGAAEGRGDQVAPHVRRSAGIVLGLYTLYAVAGTVALRLAGMGWFDAVNHAMAAVSTGGFSTRVESIAYWDSPLIEVVTIVLMLAGTLNFLTAWALFRGKLGPFLKNGEVRVVGVLFPLASAAILVGVLGQVYPEAERAVRVAVFEVVSAGSTTGFSSTTYSVWPGMPILVLITLMLVGGGTGSTAGGIKQYRVYLLARAVVWETRRRLAPPSAVAAHAVWVGEQRRWVDDAQIREAAVYVALYLMAFAGGAVVISAHGYPLQDALFEFASALGTVGLSVGVTAADAPVGVLWTEIAGMLLGRLEFYALFVGMHRVARDAFRAAGAPRP